MCSPFLFAAPSLTCYKEEIFGPVLLCVKVPTLEAAIAFTNANSYGNGCAIFTTSGAAARKYQMEIDVGQVRTNNHSMCAECSYSDPGRVAHLLPSSLAHQID